MEEHDLITRLRVAGVPHALVGKALGRSQPAGTRLLNGQRGLKAHEIPKLEELLKAWQTEVVDAGLMPSRPAAPKSKAGHGDDDSDDRDDTITYVPIDILPTFAGMGGGGTGEGDVEKGLVPRHLIEDVFRGSAHDFILIRVRGDSMEPIFHHDDELLVDKRDINPTQPGPFAIWHEDAYVVKNVERVLDGQVRIFSSNPKYTSVEQAREETRIIGRPVWFGRRL